MHKKPFQRANHGPQHILPIDDEASITALMNDGWREVTEGDDACPNLDLNGVRIFVHPLNQADSDCPTVPGYDAERICVTTDLGGADERTEAFPTVEMAIVYAKSATRAYDRLWLRDGLALMRAVARLSADESPGKFGFPARENLKQIPPIRLCFPDFDDPDTVAELIRDGWEDRSYENDACPSWVKGPLELYIDYSDQDLSANPCSLAPREYAAQRFMVGRAHDCGDNWQAFGSLSELLVAAKALLAE